MALPWPISAPTLPRSVAAPGRSDTARSARAGADRSSASRGLVHLATSPATALVALLVGLGLLFVVPLVGLPFVALVVLPATVYHLRADRRPRYRRGR